MAKQKFYNFLGTYNKAYKNKIVDKKEFQKFLEKLKNLFVKLSTIDNTNEELLKGVFNETVLNDYETLLNDNRMDLSIRKDNKTQVIFEFKTPINTNEMLQLDSEDINKKALQEAIWYFYNQDSKEISYNIKNIVITDTEHLFFFNPKAFCNKDLETICLKFRNNQVAYTDTKTLYRQLGEKIKDKNIQFEYSEFNLVQYKDKIINNNLNDKDIRQLKYLFKALHPDFLLREFAPKDSNELNSKFYNELLYIIGLQEEGKGQKKIVPSHQKGTLRDRIVNDLNCCNSFDDTINLIIVWLNRLLFLKLFESQLISFNNNDTSYAFLNYDRISDFSKLNKLFFNILGKPISDREEKKIPYLNSSLFERSKLEEKYGNIANLDNDETLQLCKGSVLSKQRNYPKNPTLLKYMLDFFEAYSFSSSISEENSNKDIINSSVLGLVFEKLNGYKDGSFFTPAYITEYMAENAINNIVLQKFNDEFKDKAPSTTIEELNNLISFDRHIKSRKELYNKIIDSIKVCDPAVGSGHFLVSILNYIVALKSELGLLEIPNKIEVQNDSLVIYNADGETQFQYKRNDLESFKIQKTIFEEKRKIIENCLFGVDINPNSVEICCLRLWIELLKNTYYIDNTDEMQILPNIDINIKCGNSLISNLKFKIGKTISSSLSKDLKNKINEYKELVKKYKDSSSKLNKNEINNNINTIYKYLERGCYQQLQFISDSIIRENLEKADKISKKKFDAMQGGIEWAIAFPEILDENGVFQGFDIIIGNPPYGVKLDEIEKKFYKEQYHCAKSIKGVQKGLIDTYALFIEKGLSLAKLNANLLFIVPMAITSGDSSFSIQNILETHSSSVYISSFSNRPTQIFDNAGLRVSIIELYGLNNKSSKTKKVYTTKLQRKRKNDNPQELLKNLKFINSNRYKLQGRYAKISNKIDLDILGKIFKNNNINSFYINNGNNIYYRSSGGRYFNIITNYSTGSTKEISLSLNKKMSSSIGCILSSTLFWYFLQIYTNGLDLKDYEIKNFPIPKLSDEDISQLETLYEQYLEDIEKNVIIHESKSYNIPSYKEYKIVKSFSYVQKIDDLICRLYGLNQEETDYIKNYELEYRISDTE